MLLQSYHQLIKIHRLANSQLMEQWSPYKPYSQKLPLYVDLLTPRKSFFIWRLDDTHMIPNTLPYKSAMIYTLVKVWSWYLDFSKFSFFWHMKTCQELCVRNFPIGELFWNHMNQMSIDSILIVHVDATLSPESTRLMWHNLTFSHDFSLFDLWLNEKKWVFKPLIAANSFQKLHYYETCVLAFVLLLIMHPVSHSLFDW